MKFSFQNHWAGGEESGQRLEHREIKSNLVIISNVVSSSKRYWKIKQLLKKYLNLIKTLFSKVI